MDRQHQPAVVTAFARLVAGGALHDVPAQIGAYIIKRDDADFFPLHLPHIGDVKVVTVKGIAPRIAHPGHKDLRRGSSVDIHAQDLAQQRVRVLPVPLRVATGAAVPHADVEQPVGPKIDPAAIMVAVGLLD